MIRAYDDPSNPRRNEYAAQPSPPAYEPDGRGGLRPAGQVPTDAEAMAWAEAMDRKMSKGDQNWQGNRQLYSQVLRGRRFGWDSIKADMARERMGADAARRRVEDAWRTARDAAGQSATTPSAQPADDLNDPESPANQPRMADASGAFYQIYNDAWRQLRSQYPAWGRDQLRQAATKVAMESTKEQNRAFDSMMRPVEQPRPPQPTDPLRKLIEDARKQMDMQDQVNMVRKQVEQEALQRRAMQTGERVMWENNRPFLPSDNPEAAKRIEDANMQKQIADQQEAFRKQQAREQQMRERAKPPRFVPGMAQPKAPPSEGTPYGEPDPYWGSRIGRDGPMSADFRDTDGDGTDDRYQLPPGRRGAQPPRRSDMFEADAALAQAQMEERHRQMQANPPRPGGPSSFRRLF